MVSGLVRSGVNFRPMVVSSKSSPDMRGHVHPIPVERVGQGGLVRECRLWNRCWGWWSSEEAVGEIDIMPYSWRGRSWCFWWDAGSPEIRLMDVALIGFMSLWWTAPPAHWCEMAGALQMLLIQLALGQCVEPGSLSGCRFLRWRNRLSRRFTKKRWEKVLQ